MQTNKAVTIIVMVESEKWTFSQNIIILSDLYCAECVRNTGKRPQTSKMKQKLLYVNSQTVSKFSYFVI